MKKNKMSLTTELDLTREGTAEMTRWCILIALHQSFGVGAARLNKILALAVGLGLLGAAGLCIGLMPWLAGGSYAIMLGFSLVAGLGFISIDLLTTAS